MTHSFARGQLINIDTLFERILALSDSIEGITVSGGEPLDQLPAVTHLLGRVKSETALSTVLFTGYAWPELLTMKEDQEALVRESQYANVMPGWLRCMDVLIAGRYDVLQPCSGGLRGSANKILYFLSDRYTMSDLDRVPPAELIITAEGEILESGVKWVIGRDISPTKLTFKTQVPKMSQSGRLDTLSWGRGQGEGDARPGGSRALPAHALNGKDEIT